MKPKGGWIPISVSTLFLFCFLSACHRSSSTWHKEFASPDGAWIAVAHLDEYGEIPGATTTVDLTRPDKTCNGGKPFEILEFEPDGPSPDGAGLSIDWTGPKTIDVTYDGQAQVDLQVARFCGVVIHLRNSQTGLVETETVSNRLIPSNKN